MNAARLNVRTKTVLILAGTLLVGGLVGSLVTSQIASARVERLYTMRTTEGFIQTVESVVAPEDEAQRAQIRPVLEQTAGRMAAISRSCHGEYAAAMDSMHVALSALLNPEQRGRLDDWFDVRQARYERWHRRQAP